MVSSCVELQLPNPSLMLFSCFVKLQKSQGGGCKKPSKKPFRVDPAAPLVKRSIIRLGGSPGLVAIGRGSHSEGCGFESQHRILDGHFFTYICCKNCNDVCLKRPKINEKEAGVGPFLQKNVQSFADVICCRMRTLPPDCERLLAAFGGASLC